MKRLRTPNLYTVTMAVFLALFGLSPTAVYAKSPIRLNKWQGTIDASTRPSSFQLEGTATHLGRFKALGEIEFIEGNEEGTLDGQGIVVFEAANGDLLVGTTAWEVDSDSVGAIHFSWRDSVEFSDGTVFESTGRFENAEDRPPGLVVIAIIAILIGLLLPAVQ